jgi:hypothetical protein
VPQIYHSSGLVELLEVSRREAELLGFQSSSGAHHSVEEFRSTGFERDLGDSGTWVVLAITRSTVWHLS